MKTFLLGISALALVGSAFGQGQITFNNRVTGAVDSRIYGLQVGNPSVALTGNSATGTPAGTTVYTGAALAGGFTAELWAGANAGSLVAVPGSQTTFRTTSAAANGYINGLTVAIPGFDGGTTPTLQVRVWDTATGATYAAATSKGASLAFTSQVLGGGTTVIPVPNMIGLTSFNVATAVPEPATLALAGIGGLGLLAMRRKSA
jgi:hypothetical protein